MVMRFFTGEAFLCRGISGPGQEPSPARTTQPCLSKRTRVKHCPFRDDALTKSNTQPVLLISALIRGRPGAGPGKVANGASPSLYRSYRPCPFRYEGFTRTDRKSTRLNSSKRS